MNLVLSIRQPMIFSFFFFWSCTNIQFNTLSKRFTEVIRLVGNETTTTSYWAFPCPVVGYNLNMSVEVQQTAYYYLKTSTIETRSLVKDIRSESANLFILNTITWFYLKLIRKVNHEHSLASNIVYTITWFIESEKK